MNYYIHYENYRGGVNNLAVAHDTETKLTATSQRSKEDAVRGLQRKIAKFKEK